MKLGYCQDIPKSGSRTTQQLALKQAFCDTIYVETTQGSKQDWQKRPELRRLLAEARPGDRLVMSEPSQLSFHYQVWLELLQELAQLEVELQLLAIPDNRRAEWQSFFQWQQRCEEQRHSSVKLKKFSKESSEERSNYRLFSRDPYFRRMYWVIFQQVVAKESLRKITKKTGAPLGTVVRIRKDYAKLKQTTALVGTFFLTIVSLKLAQAYSSNPILQVGICGMMTALIIYFSYSDSQTD